MVIRNIQEEIEKKTCFHPYATFSRKTKGRVIYEDEDDIRVCFERDGHRILHSLPFRRLKHKTQVFFLPENDHICTRMEHSLHVSSISCTIAKCLGLNIELVDAIAKGHDLGHAPFGHCGEEILKEVTEEYNIPFEHEIHGLRVVDRLALIPERPGSGLNLTFEVRDGIACHYGEKIEKKLQPNFKKSPDDLDNTIRGRDLDNPIRGKMIPATLEGCVVRFVDKVAYLGRDMEDAIDAKLIEKKDIPDVVKDRLGDTNGKIIGTLVTNIIKNNQADEKVITLDPEIHKAMEALLGFNYDRIYTHNEVEKYKKNAKRTITSLFNHLFNYLGGMDKTQWSKERPAETRTHYWLHDYIDKRNLSEESAAQIVLDYISGMTDNFAVSCFIELFVPKAIA